MADELGEYPLAPIADVEPIFVRQMMLGAMALTYRSAVPDLTMEEAHDAARATWDTEWPTDPQPRTFDDAVEAVRCDLEYWKED